MIDKGRKKNKFFKEAKIIRSRLSRLKDSYERSYPLRQILQATPEDEEFVDFIEVTI